MPVKAVAILGTVLLAVGLVSSRAAVESRGLRNNNPGNLRDSGDTWVGELGADSGGYVIFDTPEHGLRALAITLKTYQRLHGINTVRGIVARYAPAADGNNETAYVDHLAGLLGVGPDDPISIDAVLPSLMFGIVRHENGSQPYTMAQLQAAVETA